MLLSGCNFTSIHIDSCARAHFCHGCHNKIHKMIIKWLLETGNYCTVWTRTAVPKNTHEFECILEIKKVYTQEPDIFYGVLYKVEWYTNSIRCIAFWHVLRRQFTIRFDRHETTFQVHWTTVILCNANKNRLLNTWNYSMCIYFYTLI